MTQVRQTSEKQHKTFEYANPQTPRAPQSRPTVFWDIVQGRFRIVAGGYIRTTFFNLSQYLKKHN